MAPLCYAAKLDPFLSLDCAPTPSTLAQSKERKGSKFSIWQPWRPSFLLPSHTLRLHSARTAANEALPSLSPARSRNTAREAAVNEAGIVRIVASKLRRRHYTVRLAHSLTLTLTPSLLSGLSAPRLNCPTNTFLRPSLYPERELRDVL